MSRDGQTFNVAVSFKIHVFSPDRDFTADVIKEEMVRQMIGLDPDGVCRPSFYGNLVSHALDQLAAAVGRGLGHQIDDNDLEVHVYRTDTAAAVERADVQTSGSSAPWRA